MVKMMFVGFLVSMNFFAFGIGQNLGTKKYCSDLNPQSNLTIPKLFGTWFGAEVITHHDRVSGERPIRDCIYAVITEINYEVSHSFKIENI